MKYILLILCCWLLTGASCKKEHPPCNEPICKLPPITKEGKNTFGCLVDGQPWVANTSDAFLSAPAIHPINLGFPTVNGVLFFKLHAIRRNKREGVDSNIDLYLANGANIGIYNLDSNAALGFPAVQASNSVGVYRLKDIYTFPWQTDSLHHGQVTITKYDVYNQIFSGTFFFTAKNINDGTTVKVTDGRFDIKLP